MSLDDFEELVYNSLVSIKLAHHLFANQVEPFFYEHQLDYSGVVMYEVILDDEDLAMELFYAITEGEVSFFEVARQYVEDTELRRSGGYKGIVPRQELKPEISAVIYSSEPPQLLKPIITSRGIHLIFVEEIVQPKLDTLLRETLVSGLFTKWLEQQVDEVEVVRKITPEC
ncbi:peptidylprolyl isomerase [Coleofasciculus sp. G1-WW12-02]|uniref:peptidylprolyl isomerase n=1 Tax=Coleofasciculus sp. G1-WW12-02 TaxID=3068483 RepID=UPI0040638AC9